MGRRVLLALVGVLLVLILVPAQAGALVERPGNGGPCDRTTVTQPGGPGTSVFLYYNNCTGQDILVAPYSHVVSYDGTYTYAFFCRTIPAHQARQLEVEPKDFPPVDTNQYSLTNCLDDPKYHVVPALTPASLPCDRTVVNQPGGAGTAITVSYRNCSAPRLFLTVNAHAVPYDATFTYDTSCSDVDQGQSKTWTVLPGQFPPVDSNRYSLTNCW